MSDKILDERSNPAGPLKKSRMQERVSHSIQKVLQDNNMIRKLMPEGKKTLLRAISWALYYSSNNVEKIELMCINSFKSIIQTNALPKRIAIFKNNIALLRDFSREPNNPTFEKLLLELLSITFKIKILVYTISEDSYLNSIIINNGFSKTVSLLKFGDHYDLLYHKKDFENIHGSQILVYEILEKALNIPNPAQDEFYDIEYELWLQEQELIRLQEEALRQKSRHKKSLSDNFNKSYDTMKDLESQFLSKILMSIEPPQDFLKLITPVTNNSLGNFEEPNRFPASIAAGNNNSIFSSVSSFNQHSINNVAPLITSLANTTTSIPNLNKDYVPYSYQLSVERKLSPEKALSSNRKLAKGKFFFGEDFSNEESNNAGGQSMHSKTRNDDIPLDSPLYYINSPPPGLTPTKMVFQFVQSPPKIFQDNSGGTGSQLNGGNSTMLPNNNSTNTFNTVPHGNYYCPPSMKSTAMNNQAHATKPNIAGQKLKPIILSENLEKRHTGRVKFFDEAKNYGFIVMDEDNSDIFVHFDDLSQAKITKEHLKAVKNGLILRFSFGCMQYIGKYDKSRKAVDLELIECSNPPELFAGLNRGMVFK